MTKAYPSRRTRWPLLLILLVFHGALFVGLSRQHAEPADVTSALTMRILPAEKPQVRTWFSPPIGDIFPEPRRPALPVPEVQVATTTSSSALAAASPASAASSPHDHLRLNMPVQMLAAPHAPTAREQALSDPRANGIKITVEYNVADAAGALPVTRSTSTDGMESTIIRQGRTRCTRISKPRMGVIDPMDSRSRDAPAMAGDCPHK